MHYFIVRLVFILFCPLFVFAQDRAQDRLRDGTSMNVMTGDSGAQGCYRAAGIAARIHYSSRDEVENCTNALNRSAMSQRDRAATLTNRGIIHLALADFEKSVLDFNSALELKPELGEIHINIGNVYFHDKLYGEAINEYNHAIEKQTTKAHVAYINRGMCYEKLGDFDKAEQDYRNAMDTLPSSKLAQVKLDELLIKKQEKLDSE